MFVRLLLIISTACSVYGMSKDFNPTQKQFMNNLEAFIKPKTLEERNKCRESLERFLTSPRGHGANWLGIQLMEAAGLEANLIIPVYFIATENMNSYQQKMLFMYKKQ